MNFNLKMTVACLLLFTGCGITGKQYTYTPISPSERPATITANARSFSEEKFLSVIPQRLAMASLYQINGKYIHTGAQALLHLPADTFQLSPGPNKLTYNLNGTSLGAGSNISVDIILDAVPDEHYTVGTGQSPNGTFGTYTIWIANTAGQHVAERNFILKQCQIFTGCE